MNIGRSQFYIPNTMQIFRTLTGIIDDYFDGYYSEEMIESQVTFLLCFFVVWSKLSISSSVFYCLFFVVWR